MNKVERKSNFELLRVIAMILIIVHHYSIHGGLFGIETINYNKYIGGIIYSGGKIGVNLFMLISGFFLIKSNFNIKRIIKLIFQVWFYSTFLLSGYVFFKGLPSEEILRSSIFPITYGTFWFITIYIGIYFLSPFINKFINSTSKKNMQKLLIIFLFLFSILQNDKGVSRFLGDLEWFIFLYMLGAYIRIYDFPKLTKKHINIGCIFGISLNIIRIIIITYSSKLDLNNFSKITQISRMNNILVTWISVCIFLFFKNSDLKANKIINLFGKTSFAVYLIHDNLFKKILWKNVLKVEDFYLAEPYLLILHIIGCTIGIYLVGTLIELIRIKVIEEPIFKIKKFDKWFEKIDKAMEIE